LDVCVRPAGDSFVVSRTGAGMEELAERLKTLAPRIVGIEATGGFETVVAAGLASAGLPGVVVNPALVRAAAQALGKGAKTDPIAAAVIAHFVEATGAEPRPLPDAMTRLLADLVARRRQIVEMMAAEGQRERRLTDKRLRKSIARLRKAMEKELAELDGEIDDQVRGSPLWAEKENLLASVPGIGTVIARPSSPLNATPHVPPPAVPVPPQDASPRRPPPRPPPIRTMARQELHRRRPKVRPKRPVHGRHGGRASQPRPQTVPRQARRRRQA